jgi:hypothetical protein
MSDEKRLAEKMKTFAAAVSSRPSLVDNVMRRIEDAPQPGRPRRPRRLFVAAGLAAAACLLVSVLIWMRFAADDVPEAAPLDLAQGGAPSSGNRREEATERQGSKSAPAQHVPTDLDDSGKANVTLDRGEGHDLGVQQPQRKAESEHFSRDASVFAGLPDEDAPGKSIRSRPELSDFAGLWLGTAAEKPEDGTATDPLRIKLTVSEDEQLEGVAFGRIAGDGETPLEDIYVVGSRLEFKIRGRTGVQIQVTLGLKGDRLKGDGIPIRSDQSRCDILLTRQPPEPLQQEAGN